MFLALGFWRASCAKKEDWSTAWGDSSHWETYCRGLFNNRCQDGNPAQEHRGTQEVLLCSEEEGCGNPPWVVYAYDSHCSVKKSKIFRLQQVFFCWLHEQKFQTTWCKNWLGSQLPSNRNLNLKFKTGKDFRFSPLMRACHQNSSR